MLPREGHVVTIATMLDESGYTGMWKADKSPEAPGRLDNLKEFVRALNGVSKRCKAFWNTSPS